ncbi:hypothetical protein ACFQ6I_21745 [Bacillus subtilis]
MKLFQAVWAAVVIPFHKLVKNVDMPPQIVEAVLAILFQIVEKN